MGVVDALDSTQAGCEAEEGCVTCGDVAVELEVVEVDQGRSLALCRDGDDRRETVEIALVLPVEPGDRLLVHAATAISKIGVTPPGAQGREADQVAGR